MSRNLHQHTVLLYVLEQIKKSYEIFVNTRLMFLSVLQLFLHFYVGAAPSAGMEMDIIVEETCTVKEVRGGGKIYLFSASSKLFTLPVCK